MRSRLVPLTVAGVLALTTGVALAETNPSDPEVVLTPVDDVTTTTVEVPTTTTETTVVAPPETTTTTTTTVVTDEPPEVPETDVAEPEPEPVGAPEGEGPDAHPENHGRYVSRAAHDHEHEGNHGAAVSAVARSDAGKHHGDAGPEEG